MGTYMSDTNRTFAMSVRCPIFFMYVRPIHYRTVRCPLTPLNPTTVAVCVCTAPRDPNPSQPIDFQHTYAGDETIFV